MEELQEDYIKTNRYQTPLNEELKNSIHKDVWNDLMEYIDTVPMISWLIQPEEIRGTSKDRPKDSKGRIVVDVTKPHIIEDPDFFRERAIYFTKHGQYTHLRPNPNPKSEYAKFWKEELHRWKHGLVRESDGEWIPGWFYFYLNYTPILRNIVVSKEDGATKAKGDRIISFPDFWLGDYLYFHYIDQAVSMGMHAKMLKRRGCGASLKTGAMGPCTLHVEKGIPCFYLASDKTFLEGDGVFNKAIGVLDHIGKNTPLPKLRIKDRPLEKKIGFKDEYGIERGILSSMIGISMKDNPNKARGIRGKLIYYEEDGLFPNLETAWNVNRKSVEDGDITFGVMISAGTGGTTGASFEGSEKLFYSPGAYNIYGIPNVFDKNTTGNTKCGFFWGAYLNRALCYDVETGEPDVIKALLETLNNRDDIRKNQQDPNALTQARAEDPVVPAEAVMRVDGTIFPVADLKDYRDSIRMQGQRYFDSHYVGNLILTNKGIEWKPDADKYPIRKFPIGRDKPEGAIEIFEMPKTDHKGKIDRDRYILGGDPVDDDYSGTTSLASVFVFDLYTDRIVAEYTGRPKFVSEYYEICRRLTIFYNGTLNYEAHPYSELVKLPSGETKLWGDVKIGDVLFAPKGKTVKVLDIPVDEYMPIYKITLNDNREILCSDKHVWALHKLNDHPHTLKNYTTSELLEIGVKNKYNQNNFFVPNGGAVNYEEKYIPIDPYTMGLILAEGCLNGSHCTKNQIQISSNKADMDFYKSVIPYNIKYIGTKGTSWSLVKEGCKEIFKQQGLLNSRSESKFIPKEYLYNSYNNRLELLKGLMDGDGHATKNGGSVYVTSSKKLADDFMSLCRSLGFNCKNTKNKTTHLDSYKIVIYTDKKIFKLPRKADNQHVYNPKARGSKASSYVDKTAIISIEFSHYENGKCVTVDSSDGLYMIGDYVVTHNCDKKGLFAYFDQKRSLHLLCDTPQILKDMEYVKGTGYGNKAKGTHSSKMINAWGRRLQRDWMLSPAFTQSYDEDGNQVGEIPNMHTIRSAAYIDELIQWNSDMNADRVSAMGMLMIYREDRLKYLANASSVEEDSEVDTYIDENFKNAFSNSHNSHELNKWMSDDIL